MNYKYISLQSITKFFKYAELCAVSASLLWLSTRLPFALKVSCEYFWSLVNILLSPLFIFLLGNIIILSLVIDSGKVSGENSDTTLYEDIVSNESQVQSEEEVVFEDKEIICEENKSVHEIETGSGSGSSSSSGLRKNEREKLEEIEFSEDDMSSAEFQRTIEEFIEKQLKFRRQESMAVVPYN